MSLDPKLAPLCKALAHPRRIKLYNILLTAKSPPNLSQLQTLSKLNNNALAHHIRLMMRADLVAKRRTTHDTKIILKRDRLDPLLNQLANDRLQPSKIAA